MNTWLKLAIGLAALVVLAIFVLQYLPSGEQAPPPPEKTYYDVIKEDDKRLRAEPNIKEVTVSKQPATSEVQQSLPIQPVQQEQAKTVDETKLVFKELTEDQQVEAERLIEWAITSRKAGRLPVINYRQTVDSCRQVMQQFPLSKYDFQARRILADIPQRYWDQYKITPQEVDLSKWPTK